MIPILPPRVISNSLKGIQDSGSSDGLNGIHFLIIGAWCVFGVSLTIFVAVKLMLYFSEN